MLRAFCIGNRSMIEVCPFLVYLGCKGSDDLGCDFTDKGEHLTVALLGVLSIGEGKVVLISLGVVSLFEVDDLCQVDVLEYELYVLVIGEEIIHLVHSPFFNIFDDLGNYLV